MTCERFEQLIGERLDGSLDASAHAELEGHMSRCAACRTLLQDFQAIRAASRSLERRQAPAAAWARLSARLEAEGLGAPAGAGTHPAWREWRWLAVAATLLLVTASIIWGLRLTLGPAGTDGTTAGREELVNSVETELRTAEQHYLNAIAGLEQIAKLEDSGLDPAVAASLQANLAVIDTAIDESRQALTADPGNTTASVSLFEALRRKVALLQESIALMNEMRKGNEVEAARIVEGLNKS